MAEQRKIMIVDDEPVNILVLQGLLKSAGFEILSANTGEQARKLVKQDRPDLILLDIMMPGESGLDTCRQLRADPQTSDIPVVFLSCLDRVEQKIEGLSLGAVDYITKPFHGPEVLARIRTQLEFTNRRQEVIESQSKRLGQVKRAQRDMLVQPGQMPEANFSVAFIPTQEAGGDFYDVLDLGKGRTGYIVADVSGHDLGASFLTSSLKALFRQNARPDRTATQTLLEINKVLLGITPPEKFLTAAYVVLDRKEGVVELALAGHPPPVYLAGRDEPAYLMAEGDILGVFDDVKMGELSIPVSEGDRIVLYTDGLVEAKGVNIGRQSLLRLCANGRNLPLRQVADGIVAEFHGYTMPEDDVLVLAVEV